MSGSWKTTFRGGDRWQTCSAPGEPGGPASDWPDDEGELGEVPQEHAMQPYLADGWDADSPRRDGPAGQNVLGPHGVLASGAHVHGSAGGEESHAHEGEAGQLGGHTQGTEEHHHSHADEGIVSAVGHEYVLHGAEGISNLRTLAVLPGSFAALQAQARAGFPNAAVDLADDSKRLGLAMKGVTAIGAVTGLAVAVDAARRGKWDEATDGAAHGAQGAALLAAEPLRKIAPKIAEKIPLLKQPAALKVVNGAARALPAVGAIGSAAHAVHNFKHAQEGGSPLLWTATAADVAAVAGGVLAMTPTPLAPVGNALAAAGMAVDIGANFADKLIGGHHDHEEEKSDPDSD